jgi:probable phosphoglycerate mutase
MKTIYFLRHAETVMNVESKIIGWQSPQTMLTELWIEQAYKLWKYLKQKNVVFDEIYSSDTVRTRHTARIVWECNWFTEDDITFRSELMEMYQWDWEWLQRDFIYTSWIIKEILADNLNFKAPNWESQKDVENRVMVLINKLLSPENKAETIWIFTHGFAIRCFLRWILSSDARMSYRIAIDNTSITKVRWDGEFFNIDKINWTAHLEI